MGWRRAVGGVGLRCGSLVVRAARRARRVPLGELAPNEVLASSPLRIGDAVQVEPALRALRAAWPDARITLALRPLVAPLGSAFSGADVVVSHRGAAELRGRLPARPDVAVSFGLRFGAAWALWRAGARRTLGYDDAGRGMLLTDPVPAPGWVNRPIWEYPTLAPVPQARFWLDLLSAGGIPTEVDPTPRLSVPQGAQAAAAALRARLGVGDAPYVVCHPGAEPSYRWIPDRWGAVVTAAMGAGHRVIVGGAAADRPAAAACVAAGALDACGATGLPEYLALLAGARAVVSVDTSASHLAAAVGTPVVVLFGAGDPRIWAPAGHGHTVLQGLNDRCVGCKRAHCFRERHFCMEAVAADDVVAALQRTLATPAA